MLPNFTDKGYLPNGCHVCNIDEFKQIFVRDFKDSEVEKAIMKDS